MLIRPLGDMEYTYWLMGLSSPTNFTIITEIQGTLADGVIKETLLFLQKCYPLLNVTILPDKKHGAVFISTGSEISFIRDELPLKNTDNYQCTEALTSIMEAEKAWRFTGGNEVLMRCRILRHSPSHASILFTFHHAIADAPSALLFIQDFFSIAAEISEGRQPEYSFKTDNGPLEQHITPKNKGLGAFLRMNRHSLSLNLIRCLPGTVRVPPEQTTWPDERCDRIIISSLEPSKAAAVLDAVKKRFLSIHSVLCAAHLKAIALEFPSRKSIRTLLLSLVNLRNHPGYISPPPSLNLMISMVDTFITIKHGTSFWELAETIQNKNRKMLRHARHCTYFPALCRMIHATSWLYDGSPKSSKRFVRMGKCTRPEALTLSNIGNVSISGRYGGITLTNVSYLISLSTSGIFGAGINSFNGRLNWNFTYATPSLTTAHAEEMANHCREILLSECGIAVNGEY